jgi:8-oxo-dGTP pyrophosphatase MutT (NUDIX family)
MISSKSYNEYVLGLVNMGKKYRIRSEVYLLNDINEIAYVIKKKNKGPFFSGGGVDSRELIEESAARETYEEFGYTIKEGTLNYLLVPPYILRFDDLVKSGVKISNKLKKRINKYVGSETFYFYGYIDNSVPYNDRCEFKDVQFSSIDECMKLLNDSKKNFKSDIIREGYNVRIRNLEILKEGL